MKTLSAEVQVANAVPEILGKLPGWTDITVAEDVGHDLQVSAKVRGVQTKFCVRMKTRVGGSNHEREQEGKSKKKPLPIVLASRHLVTKVRQSLREANQNYLDTAGNIYLDFPGIYVLRESNEAPLVNDTPKRRQGETFNPTATRVGLQLLLDPQLANASFRELAARSGVSLRSVNLAMDAFKADGFVEETPKAGWRLVKRESFFQRWVEGYNRRLRPKLELGTYSKVGVNKNFEVELELEEGVGCWGGDKGATALGKGIRSYEFQAYVYGKPTKVIAKNHLRLDPSGAFGLLTSVWTQAQEPKPMVAPVFVIYADLMNTRDPRCEETAARLFEDVIKGKLDD